MVKHRGDTERRGGERKHGKRGWLKREETGLSEVKR